LATCSPTGRGSAKRLQRFWNRAANSGHGVSELAFCGGAAATAERSRRPRQRSRESGRGQGMGIIRY
jgi:hypothetical protein